MPLAAEKPITSYFPKVSAGQKRKATRPDQSLTLTKKSRVKKHPTGPQIDPPKATPPMKEVIPAKAVSIRGAKDAERSAKGTEEVLDVIEIPSDEPEGSNPDPASPPRESYQDSPRSYRFLEPSSLVETSFDSPRQSRQHSTFNFSSPTRPRPQPTQRSSFVRSNRKTVEESPISSHTTPAFVKPPIPGWSIPNSPETPERVIESSQTQYLSPFYAQPDSPLKRSPTRNDEVIPSSQSQEIELRYHSSLEPCPSLENEQRKMYLFAGFDNLRDDGEQPGTSQKEHLVKKIPAPDFTQALRHVSPQPLQRSPSPLNAEAGADNKPNSSQPPTWRAQADEQADRFDPFQSSQTHFEGSPSQRESEYPESYSLPSPVKQFQAMFECDDDESYPPDFPESLR